MSKKSFPAFIASNGIILQPLCHLAWVSCDEFDKLYLPGEGCGGNEAPIPLDDWPAVKQAIRELNNEKAKEAIRELIKDAVEDVETWPDWKKNYSLLATCSTTLEPRAKKEKDMKEDRYEFPLKEWEYTTEPEPFELPAPTKLILTRKKPKVKVEYCLHEGYKSTQYGQYHIVQFRVTGHMDKAHLQYDTGRGIMFFVRPRYNTTRYNTYESMTDDVTIAQDAFSKWSAPVLLPESVYSRLNEITKALEEKANGGKG